MNNYLEQSARIVADIFKTMSKEESDLLQNNHHVLWYNLEDLVQMFEIIDGNRRQRLQERLALEEEIANDTGWEAWMGGQKHG